MMLKINRRSWTAKVFKAAILLIYVFSFFPVYPSQAQVAEGMGITISPVKYEYNAKPGEIITGRVKFFNVTSSQKTLYLRTLNFLPIGETGFPGFIAEKDDTNPYEDSLKDWIRLETTQLTVDPVTDDRNVPEVITFEIHVPENAAPGGHYAGILQSLKAPGQETELDASGMVISPESSCLIIVNVEGDITRRVESEQFYVTDPFKKDKKPMKLFEYPPVMFVARINNKGNTHVKPKGNIFLYKGDKQIATFKINEDEGNVLKDSIRRFEIDQWGNNAFITREAVVDDDGKTVMTDEGNVKTKLKINWDGITKFAIGKYEARLALVYDDNDGNKAVVRDSVTFWVIPWKLILLLILVIVIFIAVKMDKAKKNSEERRARKASRAKAKPGKSARSSASRS